MNQSHRGQPHTGSPHEDHYAMGATVGLVGLIILGLCNELWLTPLHPGGSLLVLKIIPLIFSLKGVLKRDNYAMQWISMLILLYFTEGIVSAISNHLLAGSHSATSAHPNAPLAELLGWIEVILSSVVYACSLCYLRPLKKAAKLARTALTPTANLAHAGVTAPGKSPDNQGSEE